jgi:hypothetical protein
VEEDRLMQVRVMIADTLVRRPHSDAREGMVVVEYVDHRSTTHLQALDAAWRICNAAHHLLDDGESRLRDVWDARSGGLGLGVGDLVEVDGVRYRCAPSGWDTL